RASSTHALETVAFQALEPAHAGRDGWRLAGQVSDSCLLLDDGRSAISFGTGASRFSPRSLADSLRELLHVPWTGRENAKGRLALRCQRGRFQGDGSGDRAGEAGRERTLRARLEHRSRRSHAPAKIGQEAGGCADRDPEAMDRSRGELEAALGVRADLAART